jgi:hypothetical protein
MINNILFLAVGLTVGYLYGKSKRVVKVVEKDKKETNYSIGDYWWNKFGWDKHFKRSETDFPTKQGELEQRLEKIPVDVEPVNGPEEIRKHKEYWINYHNARDYYNNISKKE